jgi:Core-2/I-Branching enzyme
VKVGFVILSHADPRQLARLVQALDREYDRPPIACHHDFGQAEVDKAMFGSNVRFVEPYIATGWGRFSVVRASLKGIELLYKHDRPDWFLLLSAADYPIMSGTRVRSVLASADCDAFLDARAVDDAVVPAATMVGSENPKLNHFNSSANRRIKRKFYTSRQFWIPILRRKPRLRIGRYTFRPDAFPKNPYQGFPCFYGDGWYAAKAKVADILSHKSDKHRELAEHLGDRTQADETYYQTVLMNEPGLTICRNNRRFAEWNGGGAHPMIMTLDQLDEALNSGAFFARKFAAGSDVLDVIDRSLAASH